ncbi:MAG: cobalt ECF transporter T component CbiQ [Syntrophomonadaceae bacterium]|nr:cobalt ECF transporter T component CbiQ [Syntrophomonadaceae bacterium]
MNQPTDEKEHRLQANSDRGKGSGFLNRNLRELRQVMLDDLLTERYARRDYWLQQLDPRLKLLAIIVLILLVALTRSITVFFVMWVCSLLLMSSARLPIWSLQKRIWGIFPLITLIAAIPAMFSLFNPGAPLLELYHSMAPHYWLGIRLPEQIYISRQGSIAALVIFLRVGLSITWGMLLVITTPSAHLFKSLRVLRVPLLVVMILEMTYRYLVLLIQVSHEMFEARKMRTVGKLSLRARQWQVTSSIGALFIRSMQLSEEVYQAMTARGYTGEAVSLDE